MVWEPKSCLHSRDRPFTSLKPWRVSELLHVLSTSQLNYTWVYAFNARWVLGCRDASVRWGSRVYLYTVKRYQKVSRHPSVRWTPSIKGIPPYVRISPEATEVEIQSRVGTN